MFGDELISLSAALTNTYLPIYLLIYQYKPRLISTQLYNYTNNNNNNNNYYSRMVKRAVKYAGLDSKARDFLDEDFPVHLRHEWSLSVPEYLYDPHTVLEIFNFLIEMTATAEVC